MTRLGQHFLIHQPTLQSIAASVEAQTGDTIIEIGPGHGELTRELGIRNEELRIIAIEKDEGFIDLLKGTFKDKKNISIVHGDALTLLPSIIHNSTFRIRDYKLVGNIPYYITGHLFRTIGELSKKPSRAIFLIQREVAERMIAAPPRMNLFGASIQAWAEAKIIARVPHGYFRPPPQVDSSAIVLVPRGNPLPPGYYAFIRTLFKQPRKTIFNNLRSIGGSSEALKKKLISWEVDPNSRPQDLSIDQMKEMAKFFSDCR